MLELLSHLIGSVDDCKSTSLTNHQIQIPFRIQGHHRINIIISTELLQHFLSGVIINSDKTVPTTRNQVTLHALLVHSGVTDQPIVSLKLFNHLTTLQSQNLHIQITAYDVVLIIAIHIHSVYTLVHFLKLMLHFLSFQIEHLHIPHHISTYHSPILHIYLHTRDLTFMKHLLLIPQHQLILNQTV